MVWSTTDCHISSQVKTGKSNPFCSMNAAAAAGVLVASTARRPNTPYSGCETAISLSADIWEKQPCCHVAQYVTTE